jgi:hypothetical protein
MSDSSAALDRTLGEIGENSALDWVLPLLPTGDAAVVGPGDDSALVSLPESQVLISTDMMMQGQIFASTGHGPPMSGSKPSPAMRQILPPWVVSSSGMNWPWRCQPHSTAHADGTCGRVSRRALLPSHPALESLGETSPAPRCSHCGDRLGIDAGVGAGGALGCSTRRCSLCGGRVGPLPSRPSGAPRRR